MTRRIAGYIGLGLATIILQKFIDDFAAINLVSPQLVLIYIVFLSLREGQMNGMMGGFLMGLLHDLFVTHFLGMTSFIGVVAGFTSGFFYKESDIELAARTFNFAWISAITIFISELVALPIIASGELNYVYVFLKFTLGTTVYSSVFALIIVFINGRKAKYV